MQRIVEMLRLEERRHRLQRAVIHQDGTEQRLLDFDIVGDVTVDFLFHAPFCSQRAAVLTQHALRINHAGGLPQALSQVMHSQMIWSRT